MSKLSADRNTKRRHARSDCKKKNPDVCKKNHCGNHEIETKIFQSFVKIKYLKNILEAELIENFPLL